MANSAITGVGTYQVALALPPRLEQTTPNPKPIKITRGGIHVHNVNFGIETVVAPVAPPA